MPQHPMGPRARAEVVALLGATADLIEHRAGAAEDLAALLDVVSGPETLWGLLARLVACIHVIDGDDRASAALRAVARRLDGTPED